MKVELVKTGDGSSTLYLCEQNEHYHSYNGAITESRHIFINAGLDYHVRQVNKKEINLLEVGMGTGLNVFLTFLYSKQHPGFKINYLTLEPHPVKQSYVDQLNYPDFLNSNCYSDVFTSMHTSRFNDKMKFSQHFLFSKRQEKIQDSVFHESLDIVYFDAFSPRLQPELWTKEIFFKIFGTLQPGGILVTYCAKGEVKRILKNTGFFVESIPGPPGKREMIRASKLV